MSANDDQCFTDFIAVVYKCKACATELPSKEKLIRHIKAKHQSKVCFLIFITLQKKLHAKA